MFSEEIQTYISQMIHAQELQSWLLKVLPPTTSRPNYMQRISDIATAATVKVFITLTLSTYSKKICVSLLYIRATSFTDGKIVGIEQRSYVFRSILIREGSRKSINDSCFWFYVNSLD